LLPGQGSRGGPPFPVVVQGPGWMGLRDARLYRPYHGALVEAGIAVFALDYRGFGDSEGDATFLDPMKQVEDILAGINYLETRDDIDAMRVGVFGSGGTGGGNAIMAAGVDERIKAAASQVPIADGGEWLRGMRSAQGWEDFLDLLQQDRQAIASGLPGQLVSPREEIAVPTAERRSTTVKADVDGRVPALVQLASAQAIIDYHPIDVVEHISPRALLIICVEHDETTPERAAFALFERAGPPKRLIVETGTTHYRAYADFEGVVPPKIARWFKRYLPQLGDDPGYTIDASVEYLRT
jgi:pimeloyl-ACP methyl ester carboxylesterase